MNPVDTVVEKAAGCAVDALAHQVGYIIQYQSNREDLQDKVLKLSDARQKVELEVRKAQDRDEKIYDGVQRWLEKVAGIIGEANTFLGDKNQATVKCGFCPNPIKRHKLSRKSTKLAQEVEKLCGEKFPDGVSYYEPHEEDLKTSAEDYLGLESRSEIVQKIMEKLRGLDTNMIGVYGFSGVGKTTLVEEIYRQAMTEKLFNDVVMVRNVNKNPDLENIQKQIAEKLGLDVPGTETQQRRVGRISHRIKDKKTLVILDDIWESIKLEDVGIRNAANCKILFTSRSKITFRDYRQEDFQLDALDEDETWKLFAKRAGVVVQDLSVQTAAKDAAKKCRGLPVLVRIVASSIKDTSNEKALESLKSFDNEDLTETEDLTNQYSIIKWSYKHLDKDDLKQLFLLCAITERGNFIYLLDVFKYSMGLDLVLFKDLNIKEKLKVFDSLVEELVDFCLLIKSDGVIRIHDLVRDAAIIIAREDHHILYGTNGDEFEGWQNKDLSRRYTMIFLLKCNIPKLPEVLECPELKLFQLCSNVRSLEIPLSFFENMKELRVLDQTNLNVPSLPPSLQFLTNLQSLCLHDCVLEDIALVGELKTLEVLSFVGSKFKHLPKEIGKLSHLRMLDLNYCFNLKVIFPNVISSLKILEELRMKDSFNQWEAEGNASLSELKNLFRLTALAIHIPNADILPAGLFSNIKLDRYQILVGDEWKWDGCFSNRTLKLKVTTSIPLEPSLEMLLKRSESLSLDMAEGFDKLFDSEDFQQLQHLHVQNNAKDTYIFNEEVVLPNLILLKVLGCNGLRSLLSSSTARSLVQLNYLEISECESMEEIVLTKETSEISEENPSNMFCKLKYLELDNLPNLTRFCCSGSYIEFPCVEGMKLKKCAKLEKFIFDSSCKHIALDREIIRERDSKESLEIAVAQYSLFDEKVRFPRLEILSIKDLPPKFTTLWHPQIDQQYFCRLKSVTVKRCLSLTNIFVPSIMGRLNALSTLDISDCESLQRIFEVEGNNVKERRDTTHQSETLYCQVLDSVCINMCKSLKNVFPVSVAKGLQLLQNLTLERCEALEEIVAKDEGPETVPKFVIPKITSLSLQKLPQLRSFYPGSHVSMWPLLKTVDIQKCDQVDIFAAKSSSFQKTCQVRGRDTTIKQPFFLIEKGSFSQLEKLTLGPLDLWYGPAGPAEFFPKLKSIEFSGYEFESDETKQPAFLPICQNTDGTFTSVTRLELIGMSKQHLWKEECHPVAGSSVFPNLELLVVQSCYTLVNLTLSTISFQNLTHLVVDGCWDMEYLATYSVAKSLVLLTHLEVAYCQKLILIVASDGDDDDAGNYEIAFSWLQHLELRYLGKLQHFGLGKCIVPSKTFIKVTGCPFLLNVSSDGVLEKEDDELKIQWRKVVDIWGPLLSSIRKRSSDCLRRFLYNCQWYSRNKCYVTRIYLSRFMNQSSLICIFVVLLAFFYFFLFRSSPL